MDQGIEAQEAVACRGLLKQRVMVFFYDTQAEFISLVVTIKFLVLFCHSGVIENTKILYGYSLRFQLFSLL